MLFKTRYLIFYLLLDYNSNASAVEDAQPSGQKFGKLFFIWCKK